MFVLVLTCCGRDYGWRERETWEEADDLRESFLDVQGHERSAIIAMEF